MVPFSVRIDDYETDATRYSERARSGGAVVAVDATDQDRDRAVDILNRHGAADIDEGNSTSTKATQGRGQQTIPVVREELQVERVQSRAAESASTPKR